MILALLAGSTAWAEGPHLSPAVVPVRATVTLDLNLGDLPAVDTILLARPGASRDPYPLSVDWEGPTPLVILPGDLPLGIYDLAIPADITPEPLTEHQRCAVAALAIVDDPCEFQSIPFSSFSDAPPPETEELLHHNLGALARCRRDQGVLFGITGGEGIDPYPEDRGLPQIGPNGELALRRAEAVAGAWSALPATEGTPPPVMAIGLSRSLKGGETQEAPLRRVFWEAEVCTLEGTSPFPACAAPPPDAVRLTVASVAGPVPSPAEARGWVSAPMEPFVLAVGGTPPMPHHRIAGCAGRVEPPMTQVAAPPRPIALLSTAVLPTLAAGDGWEGGLGGRLRLLERLGGTGRYAPFVGVGADLALGEGAPSQVLVQGGLSHAAVNGLPASVYGGLSLPFLAPHLGMELALVGIRHERWLLGVDALATLPRGPQHPWQTQAALSLSYHQPLGKRP